MAELPLTHRPAPHVVDRIHRARVEDRKKRDALHGGRRLPLSKIGGCERNLWAMVNGVPEDSDIEPRILELFALGNAIEAHLVDALRMAGYGVEDLDPATGEQFRVVLHGAKATGRIDGIVTIPSDGRRVMFEAKSASKKKFDALVEAGSYAAWNAEYLDQVQVYMGEMHLTETLVLVYCKDDSRIWAEYVRLDTKRHAALVDKALRVVSAEELLPRPSAATSNSCAFCKWCPRSDWCWSPVREAKFDE